MKHRATSRNEDQHISGDEAAKVLDLLCVKLGFCLSPLWTARLRDNPPKSAQRFADTVFRAEGLDSETADSSLYRSVLELVEQAFQRSTEDLEKQARAAKQPKNTHDANDA